MKKKKFEPKNIIISIVMIVILLLILEGFFRVAYPIYQNYNTEMWRYAKDMKMIVDNPKIAHEHKPNTEKFLYGAEISINSRGWRDKEYSMESDNYRIMILGDSITLGWGVKEEEVFTRRLEKMLGVEVINTGVGNYNTEMEVYSFLKKGQQYNPDMIILAYYINDAEITHSNPGALQYALMKSYVYGFISDKMINARIRLNPQNQFQDFYSNLYEPEFEGRKRAEQSMGLLADYAKMNNKELHIVIIPEMHSFNPYPFEQVTQFVQETGKKLAVPVYDLLPYFKGKEPTSLWVSLEDAHPNSEGHRIIAEGIYNSIFEGRQ